MRMEYYKQFYVKKLDNLDEMNRFLQRQKLSQLSQEETENSYSPILSQKLDL